MAAERVVCGYRRYGRELRGRRLLSARRAVLNFLFGRIDFDGRPVDAAALEAMRGAVAYGGTDGGGIWLNGPAGLGQVETHITPESVYESGPLVSADGNLAMVATARLDNRDELCDRFEIPQPDRTQTPDTHLVLRAFQTWGESCPEHLYGDWAFAAWRQRERRLFLARDQFGYTGFYYHRSARFFAFASIRKSLLALDDVPRRADELFLAQIMAVLPSDGTGTAHQSITRLPPAHTLTLSESGDVATREYWRLDNVPAVRFGSDDEYIERFLELYGAAVRVRLRSRRPVATTLSAGLDSGSVTVLAARELASRGERLVSFTSVPLFAEAERERPEIVINEWPLASMTAAYAGNVDHVPVAAADTSPVDTIDRALRIHDEPLHAAGNYHWILSMLDDARRRGVGALLLGQFGNGGVSWGGDPQRILRALLQGQWMKAWKATAAWKRGHGRSWTTAVRSRLAAPIWRILQGKWVEWRGLAPDPWGGDSLLNSAFISRLLLTDAVRKAALKRVPSIRDASFMRFATLLPGVNSAGALYQEMSAAYGIEMRDPTADARLLEFCFGLPDDQFARGSRDRLLMRRAMEGLLPPEVQWNERRGVQGADLAYRLMASREAIDERLRRLVANPAATEIIDIHQLMRAWEMLPRQNPTIRHRKASALMCALSVTSHLAESTPDVEQ